MGKKTKATTTPTDPKEIWRKNPETVREFLEQRPDYEQLCIEVAYILKKKLKDRGVETSTVTWRAKTLNSFIEKISRKSYKSPFNEIEDFAGVRVVCLYVSDIPVIEEIITTEFDVKEKIDKLNDKGADRFGYGAIHYVVRLGTSSSGARYDDLRARCCELQVRTVLQDAWAIIDHHLVYKNESDIPTELQRKLNSLAGLFETADDQFNRIRTDRQTYLEGIRRSKDDPNEFLKTELNRDTFAEYLSWKFPHLRQEEYTGHLDRVFSVINKNKYPALSDLDASVNRSEKARAKVAAQLWTENQVSAAASQLGMALALTDPAVLSLPSFASPEIVQALKQHALFS